MTNLENIQDISLPEALLFLIGMLVGYFLFWFILGNIRNFYKPTAGRIYFHTAADKFVSKFMLVEGWHPNDPRDEDNYDSRYEKWETLPDEWGAPGDYNVTSGKFEKKDSDDPSKMNSATDKSYKPKRSIQRRILNLTGYVTPGVFPFRRKYSWEHEWTKSIDKGKEKPGETILWQSEDSPKIVVAKRAKTDFLFFQTNYPIITPPVDTGAPKATIAAPDALQLVQLIILQNQLVRLRNGYRALFMTNSHTETLGADVTAVTRDIAGNMGLEDIVRAKNEQGDEKSFSHQLLDIINKSIPGVNQSLNQRCGLEICASNYLDHKAANQKSQDVIDAFSNVFIAEKQKEEATLRGQGAGAEYAEKQKQINEVDVQLIRDKGDAEAEAIAARKAAGLDPNVEAMADAIKGHNGTLVMSDKVVPTIEVNK